MKRVVIIAFVFVGLAAVSCSKECIRPAVPLTEETPEWKSLEVPSSDTDNASNPAGAGGITDPNNDKDGTTRRRQ